MELEGVKSKNQITRSALLEMGLPFEVEEKSMTLHGCDWSDEFVKFWFRDSENKNVPDEINVVGLNNDVTLMEDETLTWQALQLAIFLCFTAHDGGTNKPINDLVNKIPVQLAVQEIRIY